MMDIATRLEKKTRRRGNVHSRKKHILLSRRSRAIIIPFNQLARQESEAIEETIRRLG